MREIIFRGKRVDNGKWVYGDLMQYSDSNVIWGEYRNDIVDPDTVSQFTGLRDKNGNRIYEGDVVNAQVGIDKYTGIVKYDEDCAMFIVVAFERDDKVHTDKLYVGCEFITETVGNKWDNPELLERE